jgi:hypothetical protein
MPPPVNVPLYLDFSFWAALVAAIAIILSQLPPVHLWFRKARLDIEPYSRIAIMHKVGNPNAQLHLILTNSGGRSIRVKGITLKIRRDGKDVAILPAQNYLQNPDDKSTVLFTSFPLKPKEEWAHIVNFLNYFSRADEKKYRSMESKLRENIVELVKLPENKDRIVEVEDKFVSPFIEMFNEKFIWNPGEYEVAILVNTTSEKANIEKKYRFTIFESDSNELSKVKDDYKSGDGINWDSGKHAGVIVELIEA